MDRRSSPTDREGRLERTVEILLGFPYRRRHVETAREERDDRRRKGAASSVGVWRVNPWQGEALKVRSIEEEIDYLISLDVATLHDDVSRAERMDDARRLLHLRLAAYRPPTQHLGLRCIRRDDEGEG
ncbi:hypothetical protein HRbin27_01896 [bacterium HR27]|nr:hypothetical protein HRbin27_01896 [bacterium HR27]